MDDLTIIILIFSLRQGGIHVLAAPEVRRWSLGAAPTYFAKNWFAPTKISPAPTK